MLKRTFWFTTGLTAGFGGAMWIRRRVLRAVQRYTPEHVQDEVATTVKRLGTDVRRLGTELRAAVEEARSTMAAREAELRRELGVGAAAGVRDGRGRQ